ncbi:MAG: hypothetical protein E4H01_12450 [Lysobacterales bacterium]|nr:MAG: hypothetical protein E4H01_12450 [Xanthomonadales bacterium]
MTTGTEYIYYAQAVGTNEVRPVQRILYATKPATRWCPFCDHSSQVGFQPVCPKCNATWLDAELVAAGKRIEEVIGRELNPPVAEATPPELPQREAGSGFDDWTLEQLADAADMARADNDVALVLEISEELETRRLREKWGVDGDIKERGQVMNTTSTTVEPEGTPLTPLRQSRSRNKAKAD